jgi:flagellar hook-associated protein 3 FlgL
MEGVRGGTFGFQKQLAAGMLKTQDKASSLQLQLSTGKKYQSYSEMGADLRPTLSARSVIANEKAHGAVAGRVGQVLDRYADGLSSLHDQVSNLRDVIGRGIANGEVYGLQSELEATFSMLSQVTNVSQGGEYLMAGTSVDVRPFTPRTIGELAALPTTDDAFAKTGPVQSARVAEGTDVAYGLKAREVGKPVADVLVSLNALGPIEGKLTDMQRTQLTDMFTQLKSLTDGFAEKQALNGQRQEQIENFATRSVERGNQLEKFVVDNEDVDLTEVVSQLASQRLALEASYKAFAMFSDLSLTDYLR